MRVKWEAIALKQYYWWEKHDSAKVKKIILLISNIKQSPFEGLGLPEPLKHDLSGYWSRRITKEHRLVYKVEDNVIIVLSCRYHYE